MEDYGEYDFQSQLRKVLYNSQINNILAMKQSVEFASQFFPKLNEVVQALPEPFLPHDQHALQPILIEPIAPLKNYFIGEEVEITTTSNVNVRELGKVKLVCDGDTYLNIEKVREATVSFRGRRMDR